MTTTRRPNLIFFIPDELRARALACYGNPVVDTPNIDRLAAQGTRFDQCHVQHTVCTPSRTSFTTGWYPHVRGHRTLWNMLGPDDPNLLKYLKQSGYEVIWGGKNDLLAPEAFPESVDDWDIGRFSTRACPAPHGGAPWDRDDPRYHSFLYDAIPGGIEAVSDFQHVDGAIEWLRQRPRNADRPFALYLPLTFPHCPYHAPEPWHSRHRAEATPALIPPDLPGKPDFHRLIRASRRLNELDDHFFHKIQASYLGMVEVTDTLLGMLTDALEETGHDADTAVMLFADHGDWAGDYGLVEKWPSALDDCLTRVPLIVRAPGDSFARGHVVHEPVELFDVMATALDLAAISPTHVHFARSLVPQLLGAPGDPDRAAFTEGGYDPHEPHAFEGRAQSGGLFRDPANVYYPKGRLQQDHPESVCRAVSIRTATHRLVHRPLGTSELYDLVDDPFETRNCHNHPAHAAVQASLERRLLDWFVRTSDVVPLREHPRSLPPSHNPVPHPLGDANAALGAATGVGTQDS